MNKFIFCGAEAQVGAIVCRNCARDLPLPDVQKPAIITQAKSETEEAETIYEKYIIEKLDAYMDALIKVCDACFEIVFFIEIMK